MYDTSTTLMGPSAGVPEDFIGIAQERGSARPDDVAAYVKEVYRLAKGAGLRAEVIVAQSWHETAVDGVPWRSTWWRERVNPAGIGITGDPRQNDASKQFGDGRIAARAHVVHLWLYAVGQTLPGILAAYQDDDPRWDAAVAAGVAGRCRTLGDLAGTWAADRQYGDKIAALLNRLTPILSTSQQGTTTMPTYQIPGLPGGPLELSFPLNVQLIPEWRTLNRPGIRANSPRRSVQHGNGNPNSSAAGEANYLYTGAGGRQASYHYAVDDREGWCMVPLDEVTWQAADGAGPGNMNGFSCEMVEDNALWSDVNRALRCIDHTAELMGKTAARLGVTKPEQHWDFNGGTADRHDCPNRLRYRIINGRKAWDIYVEAWNRYRLRELAGATPTFAKGDRVRVTRYHDLYVGPGGEAKTFQLPPGAVGTIISEDGPKADQYGTFWWDTQWTAEYAGGGSGFLPENALEKTTERPAPVPTYATPLPIAALAATDLKKYDTAPGVVTDNETEFVFVADVVEAIRDTGRYQWASESAPRLGPDITAGERFVVSWVCKAGDGQFWYITPWWTRVRYADTKRISDAPLV